MLRLGIMQPYFFPYIGYFELIAQTNQWVVFDVAQYSRKSWMSRNRILHPQKKWNYIKINVMGAPRGTEIAKMKVLNMEDGRSKILGQLAHYQKHAPFFKQVQGVVNDAFARTADKSLCGINIAALLAVCDYLGISFNWRRASELGINPREIEHPGQWALRISEMLGANTYLNPIGGKDIFKLDEWHKKNIKIHFTQLPTLHYDCSPYTFEPFLSIIDVMMWLSPESLRKYLFK